jgi:hypothetical protein
VWSSEADAQSDVDPATSVYQTHHHYLSFNVSGAVQHSRRAAGFRGSTTTPGLVCLPVQFFTRVYSEKLMSLCVARA